MDYLKDMIALLKQTDFDPAKIDTDSQNEHSGYPMLSLVMPIDYGISWDILV